MRERERERGKERERESGKGEREECRVTVGGLKVKSQKHFKN